MAEVVKVPVVGKVKKPVLYAGGAAVAGIVGYAWWTRGALVADESLDVEFPATDFEAPTVVDSGISVGGGPITGEPIARTNVEWVTMAREQAAGFGASEALTNSAISKYLGKARLTVAEVALISAIVAVLGQPPTGGPYSILPADVTPPPPHTDPPTPPPPTTPPPTTPPPGTPKPAAPGPPGFINGRPLGGMRYEVNFMHPPTATTYRYRWEHGSVVNGRIVSNVSAWAGISRAGATPKTGYKAGWGNLALYGQIRGTARFPRPTTVNIAVQSGNAGGWGGIARARITIR
jgi:hypothetical protein